MRGYTPWRVEEVGKLHHDSTVRMMKDSKVHTDDIVSKYLGPRLIMLIQEHFDQGPDYDTEFPNKWPQAPELSGFQLFMEAFYRQCNDVCLTLMQALEVAWGIEDGSLTRSRAVPDVLHPTPISVPSRSCSKTAPVA